jgi:hypothetical protein
VFGVLYARVQGVFGLPSVAAPPGGKIVLETR